MNAKEMFEELGYPFKSNTEKYIVYGDDMNMIRFDLVIKGYEAFHIIGNAIGGVVLSMIITTNEHKAITQQIKELGWIE